MSDEQDMIAQKIEKYKAYYAKVDKMFPLKSFVIYGKEMGEGKDVPKLTFYHGHWDSRRPHILCFFAYTDEEIAYQKKCRESYLTTGKAPDDEAPAYRKKSYIGIDTIEKQIGFIIAEDDERHGFAESIYYNARSILEKMGIEDKGKYKIAVNQNTDHDFFKGLAIKRLLAKIDTPLNEANGEHVMEELGEFTITMRFKDFNTLIQYAVDSGVPMKKIAKAINDNGFNVYKGLFSYREDLQQFNGFGITGIRPTRMHNHFIKDRNLSFMQAVGRADSNDASNEFRKLIKHIKDKQKKAEKENEEIEKENARIREENARIKEENKIPGNEKKKIKMVKTLNYIPPFLKKYGPTVYLILEWSYSELLIRDINPSLKADVREAAITVFDRLDPERNHEWSFDADSYSNRVLEVLYTAGLMDKDTYIALYQKALNRNYDLKAFRHVTSRYVDYDVAQSALAEISQNTYYPAPKGVWQKSYSWEPNYKVQRVDIPAKVVKRYNNDSQRIKEALINEIKQDGKAKNTPIKTDMIAKLQDGRVFTAANLEDWMLGIPGRRGYMSMKGNVAITFPPQTPEFPLELVREKFKRMEGPNYGVRDEIE